MYLRCTFWCFDTCLHPETKIFIGNKKQSIDIIMALIQLNYWVHYFNYARNKSRAGKIFQVQAGLEEEKTPNFENVFLTKDQKECILGNSLAVQWLGLCTSASGGVRSIPGLETKIPHATQYGQKKKRIKLKVEMQFSSILFWSQNHTVFRMNPLVFCVFVLFDRKAISNPT